MQEKGALAVAPGYVTEKQAGLRRLRRIEVQILGLECLVDEEEHCTDILSLRHR
jgi:DNA-binding FrmR family transcriptional regulator